MVPLAFGDVKKGDYIKCGEPGNQKIWKVEYISWFDDGKLRDFKMIDKHGNPKIYSFLEKDTLFKNGSLVAGYEYEENEHSLFVLEKVKEIIDNESSAASKVASIKRLLARL